MPKTGNNSRDAFDFEELEVPTAPVRLRRVPLPLNGNERYQWRLMSILIALHACRGKSSTVEQLHSLVWAINDPVNADRFEAAWHNTPLTPLRGYVAGLLETLEWRTSRAWSSRQQTADRSSLRAET